MSIILALDLGKFKTVACWYDVSSGEVRFQTILSNSGTQPGRKN